MYSSLPTDLTGVKSKVSTIDVPKRSTPEKQKTYTLPTDLSNSPLFPNKPLDEPITSLHTEDYLEPFNTPQPFVKLLPTPQEHPVPSFVIPPLVLPPPVIQEEEEDLFTSEEDFSDGEDILPLPIREFIHPKKIDRRYQEDDTDALVTQYTRKTFPKNSKWLDENGTRYVPTTRRGIYAFKMKNRNQPIPDGLITVKRGKFMVQGYVRTATLKDGDIVLDLDHDPDIPRQRSLICGVCEVDFFPIS